MQKTIELPHAKVLEHYNKADAPGRKLLHNLFGKELGLKITERVKSFQDACEVIGIDPDMVKVQIGSGIPQMEQDAASFLAYMKLIIIARALNEGWVPDWSNDNEYKYFPYFSYTPGVGFSGTGYDGWGSGSYVGSRLCFKSSELALYAGQQFEAIYNDFFIIK